MGKVKTNEESSVGMQMSFSTIPVFLKLKQLNRCLFLQLIHATRQLCFCRRMPS